MQPADQVRGHASLDNAMQNKTAGFRRPPEIISFREGDQTAAVIHC